VAYANKEREGEYSDGRRRGSAPEPMGRAGGLLSGEEGMAAA